MVSPQMTSPIGGDTTDGLHSYIMSIYQSCVESSTNVNGYLLSSAMVCEGTTFNNIFRVFYRDFYRLVLVTKWLSSLKGKDEIKDEIDKWFQESESVLDRNKHRNRRQHAKKGLVLFAEWVKMLYDKQIIRNVRT